MLLNRRKFRAILNTIDITTEITKPNTDPVLFELTTADALYLGWHDKFASRYFQFVELNTNLSTVSVKYWNGVSFVAVDDVIDQTIGFSKNGFISWVNKNDWQKKTQSGIDEELFWVEIKVSADLSTNTELSAILNVFSDDELVRVLYPEIIADSRYLPPGRTDFLEQHILAKDMVVTRLIQKKVIVDESQIIDINQVAIAAAHAAVMIVLTPIAKSEQSLALLARARDNFEAWLNDVSFAVDQNKDGILSDLEKDAITTGFIFRR